MEKHGKKFYKYMTHYFSEAMQLDEAVTISNALDASHIKNKISITNIDGQEFFSIILL